jgi:hypothetical protein
MFTVLFFVIIEIFVIIVFAIFIIITGRNWLWSLGGGRLRHQGIRRGSREGGRIAAAPLEGLTLFQGLATVIEELGVLLVLATEFKETGVVALI